MFALLENISPSIFGLIINFIGINFDFSLTFCKNPSAFFSLILKERKVLEYICTLFLLLSAFSNISYSFLEIN